MAATILAVQRRLRRWANGDMREHDVAVDVRRLLDHLDQLMAVVVAARETDSALGDVDFTADDSDMVEQAERAVGALSLALVTLDGYGS